jgi:hypothetical protein
MSHAAILLDCDLCRLQLESNMVLAMAGHYMGTICERMQVLGSLVWVQLTEFSHLLERLKIRAGLQSGPGVLLCETEEGKSRKIGAVS